MDYILQIGVKAARSEAVTTPAAPVPSTRIDHTCRPYVIDA